MPEMVYFIYCIILTDIVKAGTCQDICKKFAASKPAYGLRWKNQGWCPECQMWIESLGCSHKDGSPAGTYMAAWFCNCCGSTIQHDIRGKKTNKKIVDQPHLDVVPDDIDGIRTAILERLRNEPDMLALFEILDKNIGSYDTSVLRKIAGKIG